MTETAIIAVAHRLIGTLKWIGSDCGSASPTASNSDSTAARRIRGSRARIDAEVAAIAPVKQTGHLRFLVAI